VGEAPALLTETGSSLISQGLPANQAPLTTPNSWTSLVNSALSGQISLSPAASGSVQPSAVPGSRPQHLPSPFYPKPGGIILSVPFYVPVNADNDNGSLVTNFIPAQRDFDVSPMHDAQGNPAVDPDLLSGTARLTPGINGGGQWQYNVTGNIALWKDQEKTAPFTPTNAPFTFYVEGKHESAAVNDATITFTYTVQNDPDSPYSATAKLTVTPLVTATSATPGGPNGLGPNIFFANTTNGTDGDGSQGLATQWGMSNAGISFSATANITSLSGALRFIQDLTSLNNGPNADSPNGAIYKDGSGKNYVITDGKGFPVLDVQPGDALPELLTPTDNVVTDNQGVTTETAGTNDNPSNEPPNAGNVVQMDLRIEFDIYLMWKFTNSNNIDPVTYYPLQKASWQVNFYAGGLEGPAPMTEIDDRNGVTVIRAWQASSSAPNMDISRVAIDVVDWQ